MIEFLNLITRPYSGEFEERIYDNESPWNSQSWTYVKFVNQDYSEWCGVFRGSPRKTEISKIRNQILILTSDYLWKLDAKNGDILEMEDRPQYQNLTVAPNGDFILADYYDIFRMDGQIKGLKVIQSPIQMDMIKFKSWEEEKLIIECDEFMNWGRHVILELNSLNWKIEIKKLRDSG